MGAMMLAGALFPVGAFAADCVKHTFFGLDPWYAGLQCESDGKTVSQSNFNNKDQITSAILTIIGTVVKDLMFAVGLLSVVMIVVGGVQYILSAGNPGAVAKASKTISGALTGLIISLLAYAIVTAILKIVGA